jgi:hypothetical protein
MRNLADNRAMRVRFTKMQGAGNDFVMLDGIAQPFALTGEQLRRLADRRFGVGADQILLVERSAQPAVDFRYRIFNACMRAASRPRPRSGSRPRAASSRRGWSRTAL